MKDERKLFTIMMYHKATETNFYNRIVLVTEAVVAKMVENMNLYPSAFGHTNITITPDEYSFSYEDYVDPALNGYKEVVKC